MESRLTKEASDLQTAGELVIKPATRVNSPTLAMRRSHDGSRLEIPVRTLRSHSRGGRSSVCVQDSTNQAGNFPLCRESSLDRATRHLPDIASQYIPETAITQEVRTSASRLPPIIPRNRTTPHISVEFLSGHGGGNWYGTSVEMRLVCTGVRTSVFYVGTKCLWCNVKVGRAMERRGHFICGNV